MGRGDRAVQPGGRAAHAGGIDHRRPAGVRRACHPGIAGPDAAARLAGLTLDTRTRPVPAARPDLGAVPDRPAGDRRAAVLCHDLAPPDRTRSDVCHAAAFMSISAWAWAGVL